MVLMCVRHRGQTSKEKVLGGLGALPSGKALYWGLESQSVSGQGQASIPVQSAITERLGAS